MSVLSNSPSIRRAWVSYALAAAFLAYEMALQVSPNIMTDLLMHDLHLDAASLSVTASCYFYAYTCMQIPAGLLFDRYSASRLLSLSVLLCALGAWLFQTHYALFFNALGRFAMGAGSAFAFIGVLVIAVRWFPERYFALLVGITQLLAALGAMGGEHPLAVFVHHVGWQSAILQLSMAGIILAILCQIFISDQAPYQPKARKKLSFQESLQQFRTVAKKPQTWWIALYAFSNWGPVALLADLWGVPYLKVRYHIKTSEAALLINMIWIGLIVASPLLGALSEKIGKRLPTMLWPAVLGVIASCMLLYFPCSIGMASVLLLCIGIACSGQIVSFAAVKDINSPSVAGTAIGVNNMALVAGGAVLQPFVGYWLHTHWHHRISHGVPFYEAMNYQHALWLLPACFLIGALCCLLIHETYTQVD